MKSESQYYFLSIFYWITDIVVALYFCSQISFLLLFNVLTKKPQTTESTLFSFVLFASALQLLQGSFLGIIFISLAIIIHQQLHNHCNNNIIFHAIEYLLGTIIIIGINNPSTLTLKITMMLCCKSALSYGTVFFIKKAIMQKKLNLL